MNFKRDFYQRSSSFFSCNISTRNRLIFYVERKKTEFQHNCFERLSWDQESIFIFFF